MKYDVCIIGGGAAGLAAAASFAKELNNKKAGNSEHPKARICILEKNESLGRKLLATGGGKCNLTNSKCENKEISLDFFRELGLEYRCDEEGRYYPYSGRAADVLLALTRGLGEVIEVRCGFAVERVICRDDEMRNGKFEIRARVEQHKSEIADRAEELKFIASKQDKTGETIKSKSKKKRYDETILSYESLSADKIILAMGGKAAPQFGTSGDGYQIAKSLGHKINRVYPILTGLECKREGVDFKELKGIRSRAKVSLLRTDDEALFEKSTVIASEVGEVQFTEDGVSGICVFNLTPYIKAEADEDFKTALSRFELSLDLAPDFTELDLFKREERLTNRCKYSANNREHSDLSDMKKSLSDNELSFGIITDRLAKYVPFKELKDWKLKLSAVKGWRDAQATAGGVEISEINMDTMESRLVPGLYLAGEIIDVAGPCGGFNLQNAWETGIKAAEAIMQANRE